MPALPLLSALLAIVTLCLPATAAAEAHVETRTTYEDGVYTTRGRVVLDVPVATLTRVAGDFGAWRTWSLRGINGEGTDLDFITLIRDVHWRPGGAAGRGAFDIEFDVDLVWPVGSEGNLIRFALEKQGHPGGDPRRGIDHLQVGIWGGNVLISAFSLTLDATGDAHTSEVRFSSKVGFASLINPFMTLARYKKNIEWRIVTVIQNLKRHLERAR